MHTRFVVMFGFFRTWLLLFLSPKLAVAETVESDGLLREDDVLRLNGSTFESTVFRSGKNGMVKFYQSWCGHSIKMKPTWQQLALVSDPSVFIANIDCGAEKDFHLCRSYHITTYPTFRYYLNGVEHEYDDALSLDSLREFVDTTLAPKCNPISNKSACSEKALKYGEKWMEKLLSSSDGMAMLQSEIHRLEKMMLDADSVTPESRRWIRQRKDILRTIVQSKMGGEMQTDAVRSDEF